MTEVCKTIKALRNQRLWSQQDMAKRMEISLKTYAKLESGRTELTLSRTKKIASAFGVSLAALFNNGDEISTVIARSVEASRSKLKLREDEVHNMQRKLIELYELTRGHTEKL